MAENNSLKAENDKKNISYAKRLTRLFEQHFHEPPSSVVRLQGGGSQREYFRLSSSRHNVIGTASSDYDEARHFVRLDEVLRNSGVRVPEIYESDGSGCYLQEDLGDVSLFSILDRQESEPLIVETMRSLARMQCSVDCALPDIALRCFDVRLVRWDLNYFKYSFLKPSGVTFDEHALQDDFDNMERELLSLADAHCGFMYRDCQSRNVMISDGMPCWIDFQGAMIGPCIYDAVSFLWQAKARFGQSFRNSMLDVYADEFSKMRPDVDKSSLLSDVPLFVLFRTLQVLGAYGFRGLVEHKAHFVESIPYAIKNLCDLESTDIFSSYPTIGHIARELGASRRFAEKEMTDDALRVEVVSFSYKKGYPENLTGNGGGFMFDCRAVLNPGRYEEYRHLTGRDSEVIEFLERLPETEDFKKSVWSLTDPAVERYLKRGFTNLQIGFGCTGGQHRSVYFAESTARHIASRFPEANVVLIHREQGISAMIK